MGQVYRVLDRERGCEVALKRLRLAGGPDDAQARFLFRQEFWSMTSLRHPNLVEALDFGEAPDGVPYMTMGLVPGQDLDVSAPGQPEGLVRGWLPRIASALAFLHGRGYVHGDLKPENVRLGPDGAATLMDLGLLAPAGRAGEPVRGSIDYMSPEIIRQGAVDARSDLYALGALLYHALTGRPPFEHPDPIVVLRAHLEQRPERLQARTANVSPEMDAAVTRLLAKEPAARFSSAGELLAALGLQAEVDERAGLLGSPLLGRDAEREALGAALKVGGRPWLVGPSGSGKTRLLAEARAGAQLDGVATVSLQGQGSDAAPYQALQPLFRALAAEAQIEQPSLAPVLARVWPMAGVTPAAPLDGMAERLRLQATVATLARAIYPRALWLVDRADELDEASRELLSGLQKDREAAWAWALAGDAAPDGSEVVALDALSDEAIRAIAAQQLGQPDLPEGLAERLVPLAGGLPGSVEALLNHWIQRGALARSAGRWQAAGTLDLPGGLRVALDARLAALSADARTLARVAAIWGASGELRGLAGTADLPDERFFAALRELAAADVLWSDDQTFRFVRPGQAIALQASWEEAERKALHDAAADWLMRDGGRGPDEVGMAEALGVANHALAGRTPRRAVPWVAAVARGAIAQHTLDPADTLLKQALTIPELDEAERLPLERLQANVLRLQGRPRDALACYVDGHLLERLAKADDPTLVDESISYGATLSVLDRYEEARAALAEATRLADAQDLPAASVRARIWAGRAAYFHGDVTAAKAILAEGVERGRAAWRAGVPVMLAVALSFYGYFLASGGAVDEGLTALDEAVAVARETGNPVQANEALSMRGNVCMAQGRPLEARAAFEAILATCREFDLPYDELMARLNLSAALLELGDAQQALTHAEAVVEVTQAAQRKFTEAYARAVAGRARIQLGELAAGEADLQKGLAMAREINNRYLELHVLVPYCDALVALGRGAAAEAGLAEARQIATELNNTEHDAAIARIEARAWLQEALGDETSLPSLAAIGERLAGHVARLRTSGRQGELADALRLQAEWALRCGDLTNAAAWSDEALALAEGTGLALVAAEVSYTRARVAAASGATKLMKMAVDLFNRAGEEAEALGDVKLDALCTAGCLAAQGLNRELAVIAKRLEGYTKGLAESDAQAFLNQPDMREVMSALPLAGISKAARDVIGLMASFDDGPDLQRLLKRAVATMVEFAGAERGFLLLFNDMDVTHKVVYGMGADEADAFSSSLAYQVLWSEEPLFVEDAQSDTFFSRQASVRALDLRSIVGVPLAVDAGALGVLIADSQQIAYGFSDLHLELLGALARRVAGAIEGARRREEEERQAALVAMEERARAALAGGGTLEAVMPVVAREALALTDADRVCLVLGPELQCRLAYDRDGQQLDPAAQAPSQTACRWVYENGQALHLHDALAAEGFSAKHSVMALGLRTIHAVPVADERKVLGVLYLDDQRVGREDPHTMEGLRRLGALLGAWLQRHAAPA